MLISLVIPCYNEEDVLPGTINRLSVVCADTRDYNFEFIFVDDGSRDNTFGLISDNSKNDKRIRCISFSRNFGHQMAVSAGIAEANGDAVILIDADLQDPPELIPQMIELWKVGYDVVYGKRTKRKGETLFKKMTAHAYYRLLNRFSEVSIPLDTGDFRLMDRKVTDVINKMGERNRFIRGMVSWVGFRQIEICYTREERTAGVSKYPLFKMLKFSVDGILSFSNAPLRFGIALGVTAAMVSMIGVCVVLYLRLFTDLWAPGWAAIMLAILFVGGIQLISIGIVGEYIGRTYNEVKGRPLYIVDKRI